MPKFEKGSEEMKEHMRKLREARKTNKEKLLVANTAKIAVPKKLIYVNPNGQKEKINTVTKKGTITMRENKPVIKLRPNTQYTLKIVEKGKKRTLNTVNKKTPRKKMVNDSAVVKKADESVQTVQGLKKVRITNPKANMVDASSLLKEADESIKSLKGIKKIKLKSA